MSTLKVLIEGYAKKLDNGWVASSATCLVINYEGKKIITDPGCNRQKLLAALENEHLQTDEIDYVFLSHCHPDHVLLAGIFEKAKYITFDSNLIYDGDLLVEFDKGILGEGIQILETPGHVLEHLSLAVDTDEGKVVIAGDVIWWMDDEEQILDINQTDRSQAKGMNMDSLVDSRKKILEIADYIIPGHGKMFKNNKSLEI